MKDKELIKKEEERKETVVKDLVNLEERERQEVKKGPKIKASHFITKTTLFLHVTAL